MGASWISVPNPTPGVGFAVPDRWLVGYGPDHAERYHDLPYIGGGGDEEW